MVVHGHEDRVHDDAEGNEQLNERVEDDELQNAFDFEP